MKHLTEDQKNDRLKTVQDQIVEELSAMSRKYDAKQLAVVMFWQACKIFRCVHSLGMWPVEEVDVFTKQAMKDMLTQLPHDQLPPQAILTPDGIQPVTAQRKLS